MALAAAHLPAPSNPLDSIVEADSPARRERAPVRRAVGLRLVGVIALSAAAAIAVLAGLAVFHSMLAAGQYRLSQLEAEIAAERERLIDLRYELGTLHGPAEIELMGVGALGLVSATDPIDLRIEPRHIAAVDPALPAGHRAGDWLSIKTLLADAATAHDRRR